MVAPQSDDQGSLAFKLRRFIDLKRDPDGQPYPISQIAERASQLYVEDQISATRAQMTRGGASEEEIAQAVQAIEKRPPLIHRSYLSDLCGGKRTNPTKNVIQYLARFFGISPAYFFEGEDQTPQTKQAEFEVELMLMSRRLIQQMREGGQADAPQLLTALMRGSTELSPQMATGILKMHLTAIDQAKRVERGEPPAGS